MKAKCNENNQAASFVLKLAAERNIGVTKLAERMGINKQCMSQRMNKTGDCKLSIFQKMMETLGYEVVVMKTDCFRLEKELFEQVVRNVSPAGHYFMVEELESGSVQVTGASIYERRVITREFNGESLPEMKRECIEWLQSIS